MSEISVPVRLEPSLDPKPQTPVGSMDGALKSAVESGPTSSPVPTSSPPRTVAASEADQLARIEDKAARIEEKYARTEALLQRVEDKVEKSTTRAGELAQKADLAGLRGEVTALSNRVRRLPGFASLLIVALLTGLVTAGLVIAALRYGIPGVMPGVLPR